MPLTLVDATEFNKQASSLLRRTRQGERVGVTHQGVLAAVLLPASDWTQKEHQMTVTVDANRLIAELREKHAGDLDAVMRELIALSQAASTATALVEQERQRRMTPHDSCGVTGDHK